MNKSIILFFILSLFISCKKDVVYSETDLILRSKFKSNGYEVKTISGGIQERFLEVIFFEGQNRAYLYYEVDKDGNKIDKARNGNFELDYPKLTIINGFTENSEGMIRFNDSKNLFYFKIDDLTFEQSEKYY